LKVYGTVNILGDFWPQRTSDISEVIWTSAAEGRILYDTDNDDLYYGSASGWVKLTDTDDLFSVGSSLIFASVIPTGWNIDTAFVDKIIMLTNSTSLIGTDGGQWAITGMVATGKHKHFTPSGLGFPATTVYADDDYKYLRALAGKYHKHTFNNNSNHSHTFDGSWRPAYTKLVIGVYQG